MPELVLATQNPGKIAELRSLLAPVGYDVLGLADLGDLPPEPEETGGTFEANATIKALAYAATTGRLCLADDSGLVVDALGGRPGVISSHYAFDGRTDAEAAAMTREERDAANNARLIRDLEGVPENQRTARFACTMVLAGPDLGGAGFQPASLSQSLTYDGRFREHRRRLPHWQKANSTYFVTFRVAKGTMTPKEREIVLDAMKHWHGERYFLDSAVVMPDHAHMVFRPREQADGSWPELSALIGGLKSFTAKQIQRQRGDDGPFWQREYFDRIVRDEDELLEKRRYIWNNPVKAGLVEDPKAYPHRWTEGGRLEAGPTKTTSPRVLAVTTGAFEGRIGLPTQVPRGDGGFGYDPLFLVAPDFIRTSAELDKSEKNRLSHRGAAVRDMIDRLRAQTGA